MSYAPVLALDIGNVCFALDLDACAKRLGYGSMLWLSARVPRMLEVYKRFEVGATDAATFCAEAAPLLRHPLPEADLLGALCDMITTETPGLDAVVDDARSAGIDVVLISDITPHQWDYVRGRLSFADRIAGAVLSFEVGAAKPDPRMYAAVEERFCDGAAPLLYADDRRELVQAARQRGWRAHCFRDVAGLRRELDELLDSAATGR